VSLILKLVFVGCVVAPLLAAALKSSRAAVAGALYAAALLAALIGVRIDPLAAGLSRVDDAMAGGVCSLGLRPSR
jgi:hypothetical protein